MFIRITPRTTDHRCWCVRMCKTKLCLCFDFLWHMGHSNLGSTPHSKRLCRLRLCGRAYELPQRSQLNAPPVIGVVSIERPLAPDIFSTLNTVDMVENGVAAELPVAAVTGVSGVETAAIETADGGTAVD